MATADHAGSEIVPVWPVALVASTPAKLVGEVRQRQRPAHEAPRPHAAGPRRRSRGRALVLAGRQAARHRRDRRQRHDLGSGERRRRGPPALRRSGVVDRHLPGRAAPRDAATGGGRRRLERRSPRTAVGPAAFQQDRPLRRRRNAVQPRQPRAVRLGLVRGGLDSDRMGRALGRRALRAPPVRTGPGARARARLADAARRDGRRRRAHLGRAHRPRARAGDQGLVRGGVPAHRLPRRTSARHGRLGRSRDAVGPTRTSASTTTSPRSRACSPRSPSSPTAACSSPSSARRASGPSTARRCSGSPAASPAAR